ncbi:phosphatidylinositol N-acetylglucosaminyltransferase GPI3 subunit [Verticillium alfalfae VaMs.102]|uniref:Phosphatidylinositol N-acetylglucosaminyltransferase GPI3 subunit n=1 Tax=Verticillium alfalfae (strain VaMs.102 / ATCC MYA-4576 / FGSC 10136) TaxID=526221 RepID=C9SLD4_VERA1|nr:phosphatidylinositol N-acetylglucosaminyltransferase GPI3 subunit [Verticillium alfalfae VaMs.102]EEY19502.1 phosphatidylinositol N-acetylglucosaminyltransferase GPI3 subunit [Verticillium alfalfae VaMs.102]
MVCDFFFPQPGGIESHIYQLSSKLIDRGHKVIVITHAYEGRTGVRYLTNGLKVYHVPFLVIFRQATFPTVFSFFPIFRNIVIRERIEIVHGHASLSSLCHEAILHGRTMGLRTLFTDHSLFGFADATSILTNKLLKFTLSDVDHVICVSHTWRTLFCEHPSTRSWSPSSRTPSSPRTSAPKNYPANPSGVANFVHNPPPAQPLGPNDTITIVVISRLFYNKGTDLLTAAIPPILYNNPNTRFVIAGSGPKAIDLEQMIEQNVLQDRVEMLGPVRHEEVRDVMVRGHIYLHPSLTEAFGTVIVEAASCGLYVVCTQVGGIPEVLPSHMTVFARPEEDDLVAATGKAIAALRANKVRTERFHEQVKKMYSWTNVAERTERVYRSLYEDEDDDVGGGEQAVDDDEYDEHDGAPSPRYGVARPGERSFALIDRLKRYYGCGIWAGKLFCLCVIIDYLIYLFLEMWFPREDIDICRDWPREEDPPKMTTKTRGGNTAGGTNRRRRIDGRLSGMRLVDEHGVPGSVGLHKRPALKKRAWKAAAASQSFFLLLHPAQNIRYTAALTVPPTRLGIYTFSRLLVLRGLYPQPPAEKLHPRKDARYSESTPQPSNPLCLHTHQDDYPRGHISTRRTVVFDASRFVEV